VSRTLRNLITNTVRVGAELALTAGFVLLLFAFYLLVWTNQQTAAAQANLLEEFRKEDKGAVLRERPSAGDGVAVMHIPQFGKDWEKVIVEGVAVEDLRDGPGHFSESAMPGKRGNFAVAGHRATHGEPFARLDELEKGDVVVVETAKEFLTYTVDSNQIVPPTTLELLAEVPGHPDLKATRNQRFLTLITCHPRWGSTERMAVVAQLTERRAIEAGPPPGVA
jgi:sortase A